MKNKHKVEIYFPEVGKIRYEGRESDNPLSYRFYDKDKRIGEKTMEEHLRFAVAYWHSFNGDGSDPFGWGPRPLPWIKGATAEERELNKIDTAVEFIIGRDTHLNYMHV